MKQPSYSMKRLIDSEGKKQSHPVWRLPDAEAKTKA